MTFTIWNMASIHAESVFYLQPTRTVSVSWDHCFLAKEDIWFTFTAATCNGGNKYASSIWKNIQTPTYPNGYLASDNCSWKLWVSILKIVPPCLPTLGFKVWVSAIANIQSIHVLNLWRGVNIVQSSIFVPNLLSILGVQ